MSNDRYQIITEIVTTDLESGEVIKKETYESEVSATPFVSRGSTNPGSTMTYLGLQEVAKATAGVTNSGNSYAPPVALALGKGDWSSDSPAVTDTGVKGELTRIYSEDSNGSIFNVTYNEPLGAPVSGMQGFKYCTQYNVTFTNDAVDALEPITNYAICMSATPLEEDATIIVALEEDFVMPTGASASVVIQMQFIPACGDVTNGLYHANEETWTEK